MGGLLASLVPRSRIVPAVKPEDMSPDPAVVSLASHTLVDAYSASLSHHTYAGGVV